MDIVGRDVTVAARSIAVMWTTMEEVSSQGDVRINHVVALRCRALTAPTSSQESAAGQGSSNTFMVTTEHPDVNQLSSFDLDDNVEDPSSDSEHSPEHASDTGSPARKQSHPQTDTVHASAVGHRTFDHGNTGLHPTGLQE